MAQTLQADRAATIGKATRRLLPLLCLCYVAAYLDRVNVGFAKLQMASQLQLSDAAYGLGAGVFFIGYFLFEVPSNLLLHRIGAKVWLARIMVTWGVISAAMALLAPIHERFGAAGAEQAFYALRFLLGLAEAGFFPGVLLYLTYWFPPSRHSFVVALFLVAQPIAFVFGAPLSGLMLDQLNGLEGLAGWQWMYVIEAIPSLLLGVWLWLRLDDKPDKARWLSPAEKDALAQAIAEEAPPGRTVDYRKLLSNRLIWLFAAAYFLLVIGAYGLNFWLPSIVKSAGVQGNLAIGLLTAVPYLFSVLVMVSLAALTTGAKEARTRAAIMCLVGGVGLAWSAAVSGSVALTLAGLTLGATGHLSATALFWRLPGQTLDGAAIAAGLAAINAVGNLGGFVGPYVMGALVERFGTPSAGLYVLAAAMASAGLVLTLAGLEPGLRAAPAVAANRPT